MPIVIVLCALLLWFNPGRRLFYSILAVIASLATLITANLGGFLLGMLLGIAGGSLAFAWVPGAGPKRGRRRRRGGPAEEGPSAGLALVIGDQEHGDQEPQAGSPEETETEQLWPGPGGSGGPRGGDTESSWPDPGPASGGGRADAPPGARWRHRRDRRCAVPPVGGTLLAVPVPVALALAARAPFTAPTAGALTGPGGSAAPAVAPGPATSTPPGPTTPAPTATSHTPTPSPVALTVTKAGPGSGTVTSAPAGITCGAPCSATSASGTTVTLTATPAAGSTFAGWSGGNSRRRR